MKNDQDPFIENIRNILEQSPGSFRQDKQHLFGSLYRDKIKEHLKKYSGRTLNEKLSLLELLKEQAKPINLNVTVLQSHKEAANSIVDLVLEKKPEWGSGKNIVAWKHPLIEKLHLERALSNHNIPVFYTELEDTTNIRDAKKKIRDQISSSFIGITSADFCIAQTATLVMKSRPNQARAVSLVPSIHVAVVELNKIIENLEEFYFLQKWDPQESKEGLTNYMTMISGPSKTGDIELTMVHGAHGPCGLYLYVITGEE